MSTLIENVAKVEAAHAALKDAIAAKGVAVPEGTKLSEMPALVGEIQTMPAATTLTLTVSLDKNTSGSIVVPNPLVIDMTKKEGLSDFFNTCSSLTSLTLPTGFGQNATNAQNCFRGCKNLTTLTLPTGFGQNVSNSTLLGGFVIGCSNLTDITGNPNFKVSVSLADSTKLTHDSLMVVINGLQTVTTAQTLTLGAANLAKLTDEEKKVATDKGWTLA